MTINVGHLAKNKVVRDLQGNIIDWFDEANGGWIIRKRQIVNQKRYDEFAQKEKDKREAALAVTKAVSSPNAPDRTTPPGKVEVLEKRVNEMDGKLDLILKALNK